VLGDVIYLDVGDVVPADVRLVFAEDMTTDESMLTGESVPVLKQVTAVSAEHSLPQYLKNMAFMGTTVASGYGKGVVVATAKNTFFGKTAAYLKEEPQTDFEKNIRKFSNFLLKVTLVMCLFIFAVNALFGKEIFDSFLFAVALAVGITPEMLPIIVTISLSKGAFKMAKQKVIIKRLVSVEDLGNIDTLCCDKTGTLTEGKLTLRNYVDVGGKKDEKILLYGMVCNSMKGTEKRRIFDNPLDEAIFKSKDASVFEKDYEKYGIIDVVEFDYKRRMMSALVKGETNLLIAKGAPEAVMKASKKALINGKEAALTEELAGKIMRKIAEYEEDGYKVIAIAEKKTGKSNISKEDEKDLVIAGFLLFLDPPKRTAKEALLTMERLGVNIKIISGDSPVITRKVCSEVGLKIAEGRVVTGDELEKLSDARFEEYAAKYNVFARITPEQKHRIVLSLNKEGHIVGFLGDGVNDAPALKAADVGISVDTAAGVAKEAADVILLKKSLRVLGAGITEGRKTFGNITKYIMNTISANFGNMATLAVSSLFMGFIPLLPSQILLNNFMSDIPMLAVSTDNVDASFLKKPKRWSITHISRFMIYFGAISSFFDLMLIIPLLFVFNSGSELFRTAWFVESALTEIVVTFAIRTQKSFFRSRPSRLLLISSVVTCVSVVGVTYTAFGAAFFEFVKMPLHILGFIFFVIAAYFISAELMKRFFFKKYGI